MGRVGGAAFNPLTAPGQLIFGGAGTPTGYTQLTSPLVTPAVGLTIGNAGNGSQPWPWDGLGDPGPDWQAFTGGSLAGAVVAVDLGADRAIGKLRFVQQANAAYRSTSWKLQWADVPGDQSNYLNSNGTWYDAYEWTGGSVADTGEIVLPVPFTHRYWRIQNLTPLTGSTWWPEDIYLWAVTTVGAGNQLALAAGDEGDHLRFMAGAPFWDGPEPAEADVAALAAAVAAAPAAYVGVDVAAAGPAQVALLSELNNLRTVVVNLTTDRDNERARLTDLIAKVNALIAKLEAHGTLAP